MTELDKIVGNHTIKHSSELKEQIKALFLELVQETHEELTYDEDYDPTTLDELRDKINKL